jgi:endonuclease I
MFKRIVKRIGFQSLVRVFFTFYIISFLGCGGLVRDSDTSQGENKDTLSYTDTGLMDITSTTDTTEESKNYSINDTNNAEEDTQQEDLDIISYPDTTSDEYSDIAIESDVSDTSGFTDSFTDEYSDIEQFTDTSPNNDTISDTYSGDISFADDISWACDCDTNWCGVCYYPGTEGLKDQALKDRLYDLIKDHNSLGYYTARLKMFSEIDNKDGWVECVYTGFRLQTNGIPDSNVMNTEHTWPQSEGAGSEPARSDLFHLFPTKSDANSKRGNYPFGTVVNITWSEGGSKLGTDSTGDIVFEPRDVHKGNVARAMFYFSIRYRLSIDNKQEAELRKWHTLDPVDEDEIERCNKINFYQHNRNPFVDWPDFVNRIKDF